MGRGEELQLISVKHYLAWTRTLFTGSNVLNGLKSTFSMSYVYIILRIPICFCCFFFRRELTFELYVL